MQWDTLAKGAIIGFWIAAPVGPIGLLCIQRSLAGGFRSGIATGLGAATADALYAGVAAFGLTSVSGFLVAHRSPISIVGGAILSYLGLHMILSSRRGAPRAAAPSNKGAYLSTVALTVANPATVVTFMAAFSTLALSAASGPFSASLLVAGVFAGSCSWWLILSTLASRFSVFSGPLLSLIINILSGICLIGLGVYALFSA